MRVVSAGRMTRTAAGQPAVQSRPVTDSWSPSCPPAHPASTCAVADPNHGDFQIHGSGSC